MKNITILFVAAIVLGLATLAIAERGRENRDWTTQSHSGDVDPNYEQVFAQGEVQRMEITIDSANWAEMWSQLDENLGANNRPMRPGGEGMQGGRPEGMEGGRPQGGMPQGHAGERGERGERGAPPEGMHPQRGGAEQGMPGGRPNGGAARGSEAGAPPQFGQGMPQGAPQFGDGQFPGAAMAPALDDAVTFTPLWVPCTVSYEGKEWRQVALRFKGNSSLMHAFMDGNKKLSMKLDFDEYEDQYPELKDQRFYGFKQLNLNNNYSDSSLIREKVASDLFRSFGLVAAQTAFYELYIDYGEGMQYFGLYTLVEEVDDSLIKSSFAKSKGNLYKPEDRAGSFSFGTFSQEEFNLKTKGDTSFSDVRALYELLHSSARTTESEAWQRELEQIFDVERFLRWLAARNVMQNWDSYGNMAHNYYLYHNPENDLITWIPWDNNESLQAGQNRWELSQMGSVDSSWPLISYLFEVPEYQSLYDVFVGEFVDNLFTVNKMQSLYEEYYQLLKDSAYAEQEGRSYLRRSSDFDAAVAELKEHVVRRRGVVDSYLGR